MKGWKNNNDPWEPIPTQQSGLNIPLPQNPLHVMIDSQRYIHTLEKKLERLKNKKNPSSKEIIDSLALFQNDQMRRYVNAEVPNSTHDVDELDINITPSYMKRRLFPDQQAINVTEVAELVKEDFVEKAFEESTFVKKDDSVTLTTEEESDTTNKEKKDVVCEKSQKQNSP